MITRIRVEAEGESLEVVERDLRAVHARLVAHLPEPHVTHTREHVYEEVDHADAPISARWFKGRYVFAFPVDTEHSVDAARLNGEAAPPREGFVPGYREVIAEPGTPVTAAGLIAESQRADAMADRMEQVAERIAEKSPDQRVSDQLAAMGGDDDGAHDVR
jgi:hypothetical protein